MDCLGKTKRMENEFLGNPFSCDSILVSNYTCIYDTIENQHCHFRLNSTMAGPRGGGTRNTCIALYRILERRVCVALLQNPKKESSADLYCKKSVIFCQEKKYIGVLSRADEIEDAKLNQELNDKHLNAQINQIQFVRSITRMSPASIVQYAIESLAGTGFTRHVQFLDQARQYADEFHMFLIETDRADSESPHTIGTKEGTSEKPVHFESVPKFQDRISFSGTYNAASIDIALLFLFLLVLFAGAFLSFLNSDV